MLKKEVRLNHSKLRTLLTPEEIHSSSYSIIQLLRTLPIWDFGYYHLFMPIRDKNEIDTTPLIAELRKRDKKIIVPRIREQAELDHIVLESNTPLEENKWGIPEPTSGFKISPEKIDLVFVPLLAFDKAGHRVGYGKGFYDRFLSRCRPETVKIGLSFFEAVDDIEDADDLDIGLDYAVTPEQVYEF